MLIRETPIAEKFKTLNAADLRSDAEYQFPETAILTIEGNTPPRCVFNVPTGTININGNLEDGSSLYAMNILVKGNVKNCLLFAEEAVTVEGAIDTDTIITAPLQNISKVQDELLEEGTISLEHEYDLQLKAAYDDQINRTNAAQFTLTPLKKLNTIPTTSLSPAQKTLAMIYNVLSNEKHPAYEKFILPCYPHQKNVCTEICNGLMDGKKDAVIYQATGSGKTIVEIILCVLLINNGCEKNNNKALSLVPTTNLLKQGMEKFATFAPHLKTAIYPDNPDWMSAEVVFSTVQTLWQEGALEKEFIASNGDTLPLKKFFTHAFFDEAHNFLGKQGVNRVVNNLLQENVACFALTATPIIEHKKPKPGVITSCYQLLGYSGPDDNPVSAYTLMMAAEHGHIAPVVTAIVTPILDKRSQDELEQLGGGTRSAFGEIDDEKLGSIINTEANNNMIIDIFANGINTETGERNITKTGLTFAANVNHSEDLKNAYNKLIQIDGNPYLEAKRREYESRTGLKFCVAEALHSGRYSIYVTKNELEKIIENQNVVHHGKTFQLSDKELKTLTQEYEKNKNIDNYKFKVFVTKKLSEAQEDDILQRYSNGGILMLVGANKLMEGFDNPKTKLVINTRGSRSLRVITQISGRPVRKNPKNPYECALIISINWGIKNQVFFPHVTNGAWRLGDLSKVSKVDHASIPFIAIPNKTTTGGYAWQEDDKFRLPMSANGQSGHKKTHTQRKLQDKEISLNHMMNEVEEVVTNLTGVIVQLEQRLTTVKGIEKVARPKTSARTSGAKKPAPKAAILFSDDTPMTRGFEKRLHQLMSGTETLNAKLEAIIEGIENTVYGPKKTKKRKHSDKESIDTEETQAIQNDTNNDARDLLATVAHLRGLQNKLKHIAGGGIKTYKGTVTTEATNGEEKLIQDFEAIQLSLSKIKQDLLKTVASINIEKIVAQVSQVQPEGILEPASKLPDAVLSVSKEQINLPYLIKLIGTNQLGTLQNIITATKNWLQVFDKKRWTLLHHAANEEKVEICKFLLEQGASLWEKEEEGPVPALIMRTTHIPTLDVLLQYYPDKRKLWIYSFFHPDINSFLLKYLLENKELSMDLNTCIIKKGTNQGSILHSLVRAANINPSRQKLLLMKFLLIKASNPAIRNDHNETALDITLDSSVRNSFAEMLYSIKNIKQQPHIPSQQEILDFRNAITEKSLIKVFALIYQNPNIVNAVDAQGLSPMHMAASVGHFEIITLLSLCGADANVQTAEIGATPLMYAESFLNAKDYHLLVLHMLTDSNTNLSLQQINGVSARVRLPGMQYAGIEAARIKNGFPPAAHYFVGNKDIFAKIKEKFSAAAIIEHLTVNPFQMLATDASGQTPLHYAVRFLEGDARLQVIQDLLSLGANPNLKDYYGTSVCDLAQQMKVNELLEVLKGARITQTIQLDAQDIETFFTWIKEDKYYEVVSSLEKDKTWLNIEFNGVTAFEVAISTSKKLTELFVEKGALINDQALEAAIKHSNIAALNYFLSISEYTAEDVYKILTIAVKYPHSHFILDYFLRSSHQLEAKASGTLLHHAAASEVKNIDTCMYLIAKGVDPFALNRSGENFVGAANINYKKDYADFLQFIIDAKNALAKPSDGKDFLEYVEGGVSGLVLQLLIKTPALIHTRNANQESALHIAVRNNHKSLIPILIAFGVDKEAKHAKGRTALDTVIHKNEIALAIDMFFELWKRRCLPTLNTYFESGGGIFERGHMTYIYLNLYATAKQLNNLLIPLASLEEIKYFSLGIKEGKLKVVTEALKRNPYLITLKDNDGNTPLHLAMIAAKKANYPKGMFQKLIWSAVDTTIKNYAGKTALDLAGTQEVRNLITQAKPPFSMQMRLSKNPAGFFLPAANANKEAGPILKPDQHPTPI